MSFRIVNRRTNKDIANEWNLLAGARFNDIVTGSDVTYNNITKPSILDLLGVMRFRHVVEIGCGIGEMSLQLSDMAEVYSGVDLSPASVEIALSNYEADNVNFFCGDAANLASKIADAIVANMVLMDTTRLIPLVRSVSNALRKNGIFVFTITHPAFWPEYRGYSDEHWFSYSKTTIIQTEFRTSYRNYGLTSTHVHRPLSEYVNTLMSLGLAIEEIREPMPSRKVERLYPAPWKSPRYIAIRARKTGD